MLKSIVTLLLTAFLIITSCNKKPQNALDPISPEELSKIEKLSAEGTKTAELLLQQNCYTCHNHNSKSHDDMLAPPLAGIKWNYKKNYPDRNVFISRITDYVVEPRKENALMKGPIRRFGIMPASTLTEDQNRAVAAFIYDNELDAPEWFAEHFKEQHGQKWK